jgi:hypothetical protein
MVYCDGWIINLVKGTGMMSILVVEIITIIVTISIVECYYTNFRYEPITAALDCSSLVLIST